MICNPWAGEYFDAYTPLRALARRLARSGHHVLRFDYFGCGDSDGSFSEGGMGQWTDDANVAIDEVIALSGKTGVALIGARAGALITSRVAAQRDDIDRMVLWDPVVDPGAYLEKMKRASRELGSFIPDGWPRDEGDRPAELDGFPFSDEMGRAMLAASVEPREWRAVRSCIVVASIAPRERYSVLASRASEIALPLEIVQRPWEVEGSGEEGAAAATPHAAIEAIAEFLG